jgi:hypothetical protein
MVEQGDICPHTTDPIQSRSLCRACRDEQAAEIEHIRAEQEDDRRAWGRDSAAWEIAAEDLKAERDAALGEVERLRPVFDAARRLFETRHRSPDGFDVGDFGSAEVIDLSHALHGALEDWLP